MAHVNGDAGSKPDWSSPDAAAPAAAVDPEAGKSTQWDGDDGMWHGNEGSWNNGQWSDTSAPAPAQANTWSA